MTEEGCFLQKILADPAEDTHRLVYADWLDEHGQPTRAEFIRVQIELSRTASGCQCQVRGNGQLVKKCRQCELTHRERELWGRIPNPMPGRNLYRVQPSNTPLAWCRGDEERYEFSRGFVSHTICTAAAFLGGEPLYTYDPASGEDRVTGRTEGLARALFQHHPIEKVTLSDVRRWAYTSGDPEVEVEWGWWEEDPRFPTDGDGGDVPPEIFKIMWDNNPANRNEDGQRRWLLWDDESIPDQELSAALVQYGRGLVNLPNLNKVKK